jgi:hypothetical protein
MNYAQNVRDAIDLLDETPYGKLEKLFNSMADDAQRAVNDYNAIKTAALKALNYIENTEGELGIQLDSGNMLREALGAQGETGGQRS